LKFKILKDQKLVLIKTDGLEVYPVLEFEEILFDMLRKIIKSHRG